MGEKNKKNNDGEKKKKDQDGGDNVTVVLKADLHCEGCASKVIKCIRSFDGVHEVTTSDGQKITVVGEVDPVKLREKVEQKTHKKVELISPAPKKGNDNKENAKGEENKKQEKKKESKDKNDKSDEKKSKEKEPSVTTAVLKVHLHCDGCIQKIRKTVRKTKGYQEMKIDEQKDLVTVTGSMDMKALAEVLQKQLKRNVEIVPPKKEGEKKEKGGGDKKSGGGGGGEEEGERIQWNMMQSQPVGYPYPFMYGPGVVGDQFHYNPYPVYHYHAHAPQMFSDENPNACTIM